MEYEITWGGDPEDACVTSRGKVSLEGFVAWMQEGLSDPRYHDGMSIIVDHRELDFSDMLPQDVQERLELFRRETNRVGRIRAAMVMRSAVDFGLARMYEAYVEMQPDLQIEIGVFTSIEDAREWLRARKAAGAASS